MEIGKAEKVFDAFMDVDARTCSKEEFWQLAKQADLAEKAIRLTITNRRIETDQKLRAIKLAINDVKEREAYIKATMPRMLPILDARPKTTE